jgi:hypothetical protein
MNETFDSSTENLSPGNHPGDRHQNEVASAMRVGKENLKDNLFIVLLGSVAISFLVGYFIAQQQEAKKREQWAEILSRQAKDWLTERGRKTAGAVEQGLEYARSAAEHAADKGSEYSRRLNPFYREQRQKRDQWQTIPKNRQDGRFLRSGQRLGNNLKSGFDNSRGHIF